MNDNHHSTKRQADKLLTPKMQRGITQVKKQLERIAAELDGLVESLVVLRDIAGILLDEPWATNEERKVISLEEFESVDPDGKEDDFDFDDLEPGDLDGSDAKARRNRRQS
jgi:hypothetical protein